MPSVISAARRMLRRAPYALRRASANVRPGAQSQSNGSAQAQYARCRIDADRAMAAA
jgi:hypothetical protein